jgi:eukaryotic-like serine/threonine-protein kinase
MIGPYRIVEKIGRGGMATVYKAHHAALARYVAIKILPDFLAAEPGFKERFQQEAVAVAKLRHPNILAVFDYGDVDGTTYIVNEFVDGGTLSDQLGQPLPIDYVVSTLKPIGGAIDYAHARGILHRDIKPSNILMNMEGTPILGDFGLAKMLESGPGLTQAGMIVGTPEYMSPEQCTGDVLGPAADLYALGVVAYQMLTGQLPFKAETPAAVLHAQVNNQLPPPRNLNPDLSVQVEGALLKALAKAPTDRYKSASAMVKALQETPIVVDSMPWTPVSGLAATPPGPTPGAQSPTPAPAPQPPPVAPTTPPTPYKPSTPAWVILVLGLGFLGMVIWTLATMGTLSEPSAVGRSRTTLVFWAIDGFAAIVLTAASVIGLLRRASWGRRVAWAASIALVLSFVGAVLGIPAMVGLFLSRKQSRP